MAADSIQQAGQADSSQSLDMLGADEMRNELQRDQRNYRSGVWTYSGAIGAQLLMVPVWFYLGARNSLPWTWYLAVPMYIWGAGFLLVYQLRHKKQPSEPDEPLLDRAERSLTEVEDQIRLMRDIFWWYILPLCISIAAFIAHDIWIVSKSSGSVNILGQLGVLAVFLSAVCYFLYWLLHYAVRSLLEPRRQKLLELLKVESPRQK